MGRNTSQHAADPYRRLLRLARQQPHVGAHFAGLTPPDLALPDNVRVLVRTRADELSGVPNLNPEVYVLLLALRGTGTVVLEDRAIPLIPGRGALIFPRQFHLYDDMAARGLCWLIVSFHMRHDNGLETLRGHPLSLHGAARDALERMLDIYRQAGDLNPYASARVSLLLLESLLEWRAAGAPGGAVTAACIEPAAAQAIRLIFEHIDSPLPVEELAHRVGMSVSCLQQVFRKALGMTLGVYIRRARLYRVRFLLSHTELGIKQIALQSGFSSIQSFSRAFRRAAGITPTEYRKQQARQWNAGAARAARR